MLLEIRQKQREDCFPCASIITKAWNSTYQGIVNEAFLNHLKETEKERAERNFQEFEKKPSITFVAIYHHELVGFLTMKESKRKSFLGCIEITAFYILKEYQRLKIGTSLWNEAKDYCRKLGYTRLIVGCLSKNPSNLFYQKQGGTLVEIVDFVIPNQTLKENIYEYSLVPKNVIEIMEKLKKSSFRNSFSLKEKDFAYIEKRTLEKIREHAYDFVEKKLSSISPTNDGKQTPMKGHPIFISQHATATCCRGCLEKWHHISKGKKLNSEEKDYIVDVLMEWVNREYQKGKKKNATNYNK